MTRRNFFRSLARAAVSLLALALVFQVQAQSERPPVVTVLCPYPYLDLGYGDKTLPSCSDIVYADSETLRLAASQACEGRVTAWDTAWAACAQRIRENDQRLEQGYHWQVFPPQPPDHTCRNLAEATAQTNGLADVVSRCTKILSWWSATYREAALQGYVHKLAPPDQQALDDWLNRFQEPLER